MNKKIIFAVDDNGTPFAILAEDEPFSELRNSWKALGQRGTPVHIMDVPPDFQVANNSPVLNALALAFASGRQYESAKTFA
ncbi:MAG: hypothetical protein Q7R64_01715 [bacterium]|nr:hypothetical protein [bacterium]